MTERKLLFWGCWGFYTDEPANVTVNSAKPIAWSLPGGRPWAFDAALSLSAGNNNITISATDAGNNVTSHTWTVLAGGTAANFTYDANGGMLTRVNNPGASGNLTTSANYTWDGLGRLLSVQTGNTTVSFGYDGLGRRVSLSANISGNVTNEYYLWDGDSIVEKRLSGSGSANITAKYFARGFQTVSGNTTTSYFYTKDHLGSVREVVASNGTTVEGRYNYGPWGETTYLDYSGGSVTQPQFGYAGYFQTAYVPGLYFTKYRVYDSGLGRWLSRDPIGIKGGINLYGYVGDDPEDRIDPTGKASIALPIILRGGGSVLGGLYLPEIGAAGLIVGAGYGYYQLGSLLGDAIGHALYGPNSNDGGNSGNDDSNQKKYKTLPRCKLANYPLPPINKCKWMTCLYDCDTGHGFTVTIPVAVPVAEGGCRSSIDNPYQYTP